MKTVMLVTHNGPIHAAINCNENSTNKRIASVYIWPNNSRQHRMSYEQKNLKKKNGREHR